MSPPGLITRPTSAKIRESLLNSLIDEFSGRLFIDLFSGTGSVGLSALSRGASGAIFVEQDPKALKALKENVAEAARRARTQEIDVVPLEVLGASVDSCWGRIATFGSPGVVWADPPYALTREWIKRSETELSRLLEPGQVFAMEASAKDAAEIFLEPNKWTLIRQRTFGDSAIATWRRNEDSKS